MKTLHTVLMSTMLVAVAALAIGVFQPWSLAAEALHGRAQHDSALQHEQAEVAHAQDPEAHFKELAEHLQLNAAQQESLTEPFHAAFAAMQELHRLHETIAAELTESQQHQLAQMTEEMMCGSMAEQEHGERHQGGSHR